MRYVTMTDDETKVDYEVLYNDMKVKHEADMTKLNEEIATLKNTLSQRDAKVDELQTYICRHLSTPGSSVQHTDSFEDRYRQAVVENTKR